MQHIQVRILEGLDATVSGLIEINDSTATFVPLLTVSYYQRRRGKNIRSRCTVRRPIIGQILCANARGKASAGRGK